MSIFLCCTPLHVLIAALELHKYRDSENLYIIVNDADEVDVLAKVLLPLQTSSFIVLPGAASLAHGESQIPLRQSNSKAIRSAIKDLDPQNIFIFFDQSAEAQALLNFKFPKPPRAIWLEDGISSYSVATPFPHPLISLVRNKIRFDLKWRGSKWLGQHPAVQEIGCFFPHLLRTRSNRVKARPLSRTLDETCVESFLRQYGDIKYRAPTGIVVIPHPDSGPSLDQVKIFVQKSLLQCTSIGVEPVLKFHPRDRSLTKILCEQFPNLRVAEQKYPLELALFSEKNVRTVIGYRTSTLHIISAIHPDIDIFYFEMNGDSTSSKWEQFYHALSIPPLP